MTGLVSYGGFVPRYRLNRMNIFKAMGWFNPVTMGAAKGEKAVANYDQDSLTMATEACLDCLGDVARESVDGLYAASSTFPYRERENAGIISSALDLRDDVRAADFSDSLKSGTTALLAALDAVEAGRAGTMLATAADCRVAKMGSLQEHYYGDGAAAFLTGTEDLIAEFKGAYSVSHDFVDHFRSDGMPFDRTWEERWIKDAGYGKIIPEAIGGLLAKVGMEIGDFDKVVYPCHFDRVHKGLAKKLGIEPERLQSNMSTTVGDAGSAHPLMMLAAALEEAKPGDKILVASYGSGSDALFFEVTDRIEEIKQSRKGIRGCLENREELTNYEKYAVFRRIIPVEMGIRGEFEPPTAFSTLWKYKRTVLGLKGNCCTACGTPVFPEQRICVNPECGAIDKMEPYRFSDKKGRIFTYTGDMLAFCIDPPQIYGLVDFDGGGRIWLDFTDCSLESLKVGMEVDMSFRKKYYDHERGIHGYFWKAVPRVEA